MLSASLKKTFPFLLIKIISLFEDYDDVDDNHNNNITNDDDDDDDDNKKKEKEEEVTFSNTIYYTLLALTSCWYWYANPVSRKHPPRSHPQVRWISHTAIACM